MLKNNILIFSNYYIPGSLAGGPIRSVEGIVKNLQNDFSFYIFTSSHDYGCKDNYRNITLNKWVNVNGAQCFYIEDSELTLKTYIKIISDVNPCLIYFNSFFNFKFTIIPLFLLRFSRMKVNSLIASRGEFNANALTIKKLKKILYINFFKFFLKKNIYWHASSRDEKFDIEHTFYKEKIFIAKNIPIPVGENSSHGFKKTGSLNIIFLSRICKMKNLESALKSVSLLKGEVNFDIYGPIEDLQYFNKVSNIARALPENITIKFHGSLDHDCIHKAFKKSHIFFLPTLGENYGNVIRESILFNCPVLIGNTTPWKDLEENGAGWSFDPYDYTRFAMVLSELESMDNTEYRHLTGRVKKYAKLILKNSHEIDNNRFMFSQLIK